MQLLKTIRVTHVTVKHYECFQETILMYLGYRYATDTDKVVVCNYRLAINHCSLMTRREKHSPPQTLSDGLLWGKKRGYEPKIPTSYI